LLVVKKTDSAGWLGVLLPWSWNPLREQARLFVSRLQGKRVGAAGKGVFYGAGVEEFQIELIEPIWGKWRRFSERKTTKTNHLLASRHNWTLAHFVQYHEALARFR
jgi:hypothetical protein